MARISYTVNGQTSCTLSVTELNTTTTYSSVYISCNGYTSSNLAYIGSKVYTSRTWYLTGLRAGTTYYASFNITSAGGSTANGGTYFTTESAPAPIIVGGVGSVYVSDSGVGSIGVSWSPATNATDYRYEVYDGWGYVVTSGVAYNNWTTISGLAQGTYYQVKVYGRRAGSDNGYPSYGSITTKSYVVGGIGTLYATPSSNVPSVYLSWSHASNASYYQVTIYSQGGSYYTGTTTTSTSISITGLQENSVYMASVYGLASGYTNGQTSATSFATVSLAPQAITTLSVVASTATKGKIDMAWNSATNATSYRWEIYLGNTTSSSSLVTSASTTATSASYSSLSEYTLYTVKVYATRSGYANGTPKTATVRTRDLTPPVLSNVRGETVGKMYLAFNASDAHSGIRSSSSFYTEISSRNGTSYGQGAYSTNYFRTFTVDASGLSFEQDAWYYMKVTAYDNEGNTNVQSVRIQFKEGRPNNWAWHTVKTSGSPISLTASEWNSFCIRINQFRRYRSLSQYGFTTASSGGVITANIVNQARSAILEMSPPSSVPTSATAGVTIVTALYFNTLSISLNSIP